MVPGALPLSRIRDPLAAHTHTHTHIPSFSLPSLVCRIE
jgi:hypothetical protein